MVSSGFAYIAFYDIAAFMKNFYSELRLVVFFNAFEVAPIAILARK